jgi:anti-sigma regulatory factor (Ser/Thr protein kinase)
MTRISTPIPSPRSAADTAIRACLTVPCRPEQVRVVREFIRQVFRDDPDADIPVLLTSKLATNSVLYSWSRLGGTMMVTVSDIEDGMVRVEVADAGGLSVPVPQDENDDWAESGHGLRLVRDLSDQMSYRIEADGGLVTWFVIPSCGRNADR